MTPEEVKVGMDVRVSWTRLAHSENGVVTEVYPSRPHIVSVRFKDGVVQYAHVAQLTLRERATS